MTPLQTISLTTRAFRIIEFFSIAVIPPLLLLVWFSAGESQGFVLFGTFFVVGTLTYMRIKKGIWSLRDIGITKIFHGWKQYLLGTIIGIIVLFLFDRYTPPTDREANGLPIQTFILFSVLGSYVQEFMYRGYLYRLGHMIWENKRIVIVLNIVLFALMHSIYDNWYITVPITFLAGILFTGIYSLYMNFFLIGFMHMIFNALALYLGLFKA